MLFMYIFPQAILAAYPKNNKLRIDSTAKSPFEKSFTPCKMKKGHF